MMPTCSKDKAQYVCLSWTGKNYSQANKTLLVIIDRQHTTAMSVTVKQRQQTTTNNYIPTILVRPQ